MKILQKTEELLILKRENRIIPGIYFGYCFSLPILLGFLFSLLPTIIAAIVGVWLIYFSLSYQRVISCTLDKRSRNVTLERFSILKQVKLKQIPLASIRNIQVFTKPDLSPSNDPGGYKISIYFSTGETFKLTYTLSNSEANELVTALEDFLSKPIGRNF